MAEKIVELSGSDLTDLQNSIPYRTYEALKLPLEAIEYSANAVRIPFIKPTVVKSISFAQGRNKPEGLFNYLLGLFPELKDEIISATVTSNAHSGAKGNALHYAIENELNETLFYAFLDLGIDPNAVDSFGNAPIHLSMQVGGVIRYSRTAYTLELLKHGANINLQDAEGNPPLRWAIMNYQKADPRYKIPSDFNLIELLIENGADIHLANNSGRTPFDYARWPEVVELFTRCGGQIDMSMAVNVGLVENVQAFIDAGVDVNQPTRFGDPPLSMAVQNNDPKMVELLLKNDAEPNIRLKENQTLLHIAAKRDLPKIAELLLQYGADKELKGGLGELTAYQSALEYKSTAAARILSPTYVVDKPKTSAPVEIVKSMPPEKKGILQKLSSVFKKE